MKTDYIFRFVAVMGVGWLFFNLCRGALVLTLMNLYGTGVPGMEKASQVYDGYHFYHLPIVIILLIAFYALIKKGEVIVLFKVKLFDFKVLIVSYFVFDHMDMIELI
ncbi:MAG: hypothetical protein AAFO03_21120 [Bacteroidota bacterium]